MATKLCAYCLHTYDATLHYCPWCDSAGKPRRSKIARMDAGTPPPERERDEVRVERAVIQNAAAACNQLLEMLAEQGIDHAPVIEATYEYLHQALEDSHG